MFHVNSRWVNLSQKKDKSRFLFIRVQIIFKNRFKQEQNLGTMEDSFTNIFKLAELNGLTWKKFSHTNPVPSLPSDDQVLSAYAKCMKERVVFMLLSSILVKVLTEDCYQFKVAQTK